MKAEVVPHPPYSPDLAPSDYYLFRQLKNHLRGLNFSSDDELKEEVTRYFASLDKSFYHSGLDRLKGRWKQVIESGGDYIID